MSLSKRDGAGDEKVDEREILPVGIDKFFARQNCPATMCASAQDKSQPTNQSTHIN